MASQSFDSNVAGTPAVTGTHTAAGDGAWGQSDGGRGVVGVSATGAGVWGHTVTGRGVVGAVNEDGAGVWGETKKGRGVVGAVNEEGAGVWGETKKGRGVVGVSQTDGAGVWGECTADRGVVGVSGKGTGVWGETANGRAVVGVDNSDGTGVWGETKKGRGVVGISQTDVGVFGKGGRLAALFEGHVEVTGDILLANADCAEEFTVSETAVVEPGTVMVLGEEDVLEPSHSSYDRRVAGVISGAGTYQPGIVLDRQPSAARRQPVALMGKVYCKVDAQFGAVAVGDLLTTSSTPGHAMRADDPFKAFGAVIGKALRPLKEGQGLIPILVALQ